MRSLLFAQPVGMTTEMMIHFSGSNHDGNPGVLMVSTALVCLDCGASRFNTPTKELRLLRDDARSGTA